VPRAVALSSTTPAAASSTPIEIVAFGALPGAATLAGKSDPNVSIVPKNPDQPNYAALVDQDQQAREGRCLAQAVYFEARSEPESGQAAVAQVVLNRVASGLYPSTICGVVFQNHTWHDACQFSFTCDGHSLRINEPEAWRTATRIANDVLNGTTYVAGVGGATHYHANYVRPRWARYLKKMDVIGHHIFYELRPGQT
jgi:spore germination cell wall hydrolase CwlJ-like protein